MAITASWSLVETAQVTDPYFPAVIDSSMLAVFKSCPEKFRKEHVENWKAKEPSVHLHAGACFARGLEATRRAFYEAGWPAEDAIAAGLQALISAWGDYEAPERSAKTLPRVAGAFAYYWENYSLTTEDAYPILLGGNKRAIEYSFAHPLPINHPVTGEPLLYCGRMDAIINYKGATLICDEKTTGQLGPTWARQWDLRGQFQGYAWGCGEAGVKVQGAVVRGIAIYKTDYKTAEAVIFNEEWKITRWYTEMLEWVSEIIKCWKTRRWRHALDHACADFGGCAFRTACMSQDESPWLEAQFERRIWNPLLRTETKVE